MQIKSHIADDLRRRATSPKKLAAALPKERKTVETMRELALDDPSELNVSHLGREASRLADHLLLADELDEALRLKEEAIGVWRKLDRPKARFLAELDAAEIVFELGRHDEALDELDRLVEASEDEAFGVYRDFALELRARCLARCARVDDARADLDEALALRRERGNARQIEQTERLVALVDGFTAR
jgi:tetratricopeptide (TPR) repeat protein